MKNGYEYYYLFGLDLNLEKYGLGVIKQPRLIDFLENDIDIEGFYTPFIMNDYILGQSKDKESFEKVKEQVGGLSFLFMTCYQSSRVDVINSILECLSFIYQSEAKLGDSLNIVIGDVVITNDNFDTLCDVVLEMQNLDKSQFKFETENKKIVDPIEARFEYFRKKSKKKKVDVSMIDHVNYLIHSNEGNMDYEKVLNMTMYQIRNSLGTLGHKVNYETMFKYKLSSKFDIKDNIKNWNFEKIVKNSAINKDV